MDKFKEFFSKNKRAIIYYYPTVILLILALIVRGYNLTISGGKIGWA